MHTDAEGVTSQAYALYPPLIREKMRYRQTREEENKRRNICLKHF